MPNVSKLLIFLHTMHCGGVPVLWALCQTSDLMDKWSARVVPVLLSKAGSLHLIWRFIKWGEWFCFCKPGAGLLEAACAAPEVLAASCGYRVHPGAPPQAQGPDALDEGESWISFKS